MTTAATVECPDCGGPAAWNRDGTRLLAHRQWRVGRGGRVYQVATMCEPRIPAGAR